ncbi:RNA-directed DNA polymerase from mobile element jockey [Lucilia cuprina]|nr:RNA-directed DNA polymerase from mobile element jockey [Lucilia cuprina]
MKNCRMSCIELLHRKYQQHCYDFIRVWTSRVLRRIIVDLLMVSFLTLPGGKRMASAGGFSPPEADDGQEKRRKIQEMQESDEDDMDLEMAASEDVEVFPPLRPTGSTGNNRKRHHEAIKEIHRVLPYSKAVKININKVREEANARNTMREHQEILSQHSVNLEYNRQFLGDNMKRASNCEKRGKIGQSGNVVTEQLFPPSLSLEDFASEMRKIFLFARSNRNLTFICGDFNAKAFLWNPDQEDHKGRILEDIMFNTNFHCINNGSVTYVTENVQPSALDVSFCNQLDSDILWKINPDSSLNWAVCKLMNKSLTDFVRFKEADSKLENYISERKKEAFATLLEELSHPNSIKDMWKKLAHLKKYQLPKNSNNCWNSEQKKDFLKLIAGPNSIPIQDPSNFNISPNNIPVLSLDTFTKYIKSRNPDSAKGDDGISYRMIMNLNPIEREKLFNMINTLWRNATIPGKWRRIIICPVPKKNRDTSQIQNYRPICLLSIMFKCLEAMIKPHIEEHIEARGIIPDRSYAFRKKRSTANCVNDVINTVYKAKNECYQVVGACLDIDKAYDNTNPVILCEMLSNLKFNDHIVNFLRSFLGNRTLVLGDQEVSTNRGLAQGSAISPILFNIFTIKLHSIVDDSTFLFQFADDFFVICIDRIFDKARGLLLNKLMELSNLCSSLELSFNFEKTKAIHFNNRPRTMNLQYRKLTLLIFGSINKTCNFYRILNHRNKGVSPLRAIQIYRAFIRPRIEYAVSSFANLGKTALNFIKTQVNVFLRQGLGLLRSTLTHILYHMAAELPPKYRFVIVTAREILKSLIQYDFIFKDIGNLSDFVGNCTHASFQLDFFKVMYGKKNEVNMDVVISLFLEKYNEMVNNEHEIFFTDGSVNENFTGFAAYYENTDTVESGYTRRILSSMTSELLAIDMAIDIAIGKDIRRLAIFTDSKSSIYALRNRNLDNYIVVRILNKMSISFERITFIYIPGHRGIKGNEIVDLAAKNAHRNSLPVHIPWTFKDAISVIESILKGEWNTALDNFWTADFNVDPTYFKASDLRMMNRILSGHTYCGQTLSRMGVSVSDICTSCNCTEDSAHIIFKCHKYANQRRNFPSISRHKQPTL